MSINKNGRKIKDRIYNGRFIARVYKNARLVYQRNAVPSQKFTKLIFDKSISDPKNITGYGEGAIVDIIAKIRRCLCKTVSSWKTTIENPQLLNWEEFGDDPSPFGWRLPTSAEFIALDAAYRGSWTTVNSINGRRLGASNGPFFPAAGSRNISGTANYRDASGFYWSSTPLNSTYGYYLYLSSSGVYPSNYNYRSLGMAVRCVRDISTIDYMLCPAGEVQIGNIIWAKSNLKAAGEFCEKETDYGCYFQWGQNTAISSDPNVPVTTVTPVLTGNDGDVMVYKPAFWYKYVPDPLGTGNSFGYDISEEYIKDGIYDPENLIAAYKSNNISLRLYSRSGGPPTFNINQRNNIDYAKRRGIGYNIIDFNQHSMIALLFYAKYGNRNSQAVLGTGGANPTANKGSTNSLGNRDTINTTTGHTSFAGIEGVHGCAYEWISGVDVNDMVWTVTDSDGARRLIGKAPSSGGNIIEIAAANGQHFDLMPISVGGLYYTYYTDYYKRSLGNCVLARSCNYTNTDGGVSYIDASYESSDTNTSIASRLSYRGTIIEEPDPVAFKALPLI